MLLKSTIQLLRIHFAFFLMPVFWFALSQVSLVNVPRTLLVFIILHLLVYPASNGYNSYMDRDTGSVGGIEKPLQPTKQLFWVCNVLDAIAILLSFFISIYFAIVLIAFILASRAYSYRKIRLKKYPFFGYFTVIIFQGAAVYFMVKHGCSQNFTTNLSVLALLAATLLVGGFYPLTQIYQHEQDNADGVKTLSSTLGYTGTFIFTGLIYFMAMSVLGVYFASNLELSNFFVLQICMLPVLVYFVWWFAAVYKNHETANYKNTMRMNVLASVCSNIAFIAILIINHI